MFIFLYINITIKLDLPKNVKEKTDRKTYLKIGIKRIRTSVKSINSTSHNHFAIMPSDRAGVNRTRYLSFPKGVTHHFVFCPLIKSPNLLSKRTSSFIFHKNRLSFTFVPFLVQLFTFPCLTLTENRYKRVV